MKSNIYTTLRKVGKDGKSLVQVTCYFINSQGKQYARISSGLKIETNNWSLEDRSPIASFAFKYPEWYEDLEDMKKELREAFSDAYSKFGDDVSVKNVKDSLEESRQEQKSLQDQLKNVSTLDLFIRWYIDKQEKTPFDKRKSEGTLKQYVKILNRLEQYYTATKTKIVLERVTMDDIDACVSWFERQRQPSGKYYAQNTIQDHEKWLIALVNKAVANRFKCPEWNPRQSEGRVSSADTDDIHFDISDLQKLMNSTPRNELEKNALVWSVIGYCTGLRHSDWISCYKLLTEGRTEFGETISEIRVGEKVFRFLHMCPIKTRRHLNGKGIWCGIPVLKPVETIISKYGLPKPLVNQLMNKMIKEVTLHAGIDEEYTKRTKVAGGKTRTETAVKGSFASTHKIGRASFITQFAEFIPKPILVKVTAHVGGSRDAFDGYIKDQNLKRNAERFIGMLQDHQDRGEFGNINFV